MWFSLVVFGYILPLVLVVGIAFIGITYDLRRHENIDIQLGEFLILSIMWILPVANILLLVMMVVFFGAYLSNNKHLRIAKDKDDKLKITLE